MTGRQIDDCFGLGWRRPLAAGILANLDRIDVVEVMADDFFHAPPAEWRALETLAANVPVVLHGVSLGLASAAPVDEARLPLFARVAALVRPRFWSEHLAFVRGGGMEIGHLCAPPRTPATIAGTVRNVARAAAVIGARPLLENVATLIAPPGSVLDEPSWVSAILEGTGCDLLLDLQNLYANALNFGHQPRALLAALPADRIAAVHLAGGRWVATSRGERRLLDDHKHPVPPAVLDLLSEVGALTPRPLTVLIERDGGFAGVDPLLAELEQARVALAAGRARLTALRSTA